MLFRNIVEFYENKNVFITGATGLLGKSIIEKLLRSCPGIKSIYVLIRSKKGVSAVERLEELLSSEVFSVIKNENTNLLQKIKVFEGDVMDINFGLNDNDLNELVNNVHIVIHGAATVRFDEPLKLAVEMNLKPVVKLIELGQKMKSLEIIVHISTAFSNCDLEHIRECIYDPSIEPTKLIDIVQVLDEDIVNKITPSLLKNKPNTYTFTKQLAEFVIHQNIDKLPIVIVRPSIIGATVAEPFPGWIDNFNAATGIIAAISKGILRSMIGDYSKWANIIPLDAIANFIIASSWYAAGTYGVTLTNGAVQIDELHNTEFDALKQEIKKRTHHHQHSETGFLPVFNFTLDNYTLTWGTFVRTVMSRVQQNPSITCVTFPKFSMTTKFWYNELKWKLSPLLPAVMLDSLLLLQGQTAKYTKRMNRLKDTVERLTYFTLKDWNFEINNRTVLWRAMSDADQKNFNFDLANIDWVSYFNLYHHGTKKYALKEHSNYSSFSRGKRLRILYYGIRYSSIFVFLMFLTYKMKIFNTLFHRLIRILLPVFRLLKLVQ